MSSLDKYILRQCLTPFVVILTSITMIVWMTQTLQRIDIIVENGAGLALFAFLSILIIPSLLAVIIPFAIFGSVVYALHRLHADSELAVMFAAGVSRWRIAAPILLLTALGALFTLYVNVDLMPRSYRLLKQQVAVLRADVATSVLRSGEFTSVVEGFTIYVDQSLPGGRLKGLLVNDYRDKKAPRTYMAERALLQDSEAGPMLFLRNGSLQTLNKESGELKLIPFDELAVNIESYQQRPGDLVLEETERYPRELFKPDYSKPYDRANAGKLIAEGHARFAGPIYAFAYVLIGLYALIGGPYSRRGHMFRLAIAGALIFSLRVVGFVAQGIVAKHGGYWLLYAVPLEAILVCVVILFAPPFQSGRFRLSAGKRTP